jgi:hypothetical protein
MDPESSPGWQLLDTRKAIDLPHARHLRPALAFHIFDNRGKSIRWRTQSNCFSNISFGLLVFADCRMGNRAIPNRVRSFRLQIYRLREVVDRLLELAHRQVGRAQIELDFRVVGLQPRRLLEIGRSLVGKSQLGRLQPALKKLVDSFWRKSDIGLVSGPGCTVGRIVLWWWSRQLLKLYSMWRTAQTGGEPLMLTRHPTELRVRNTAQASFLQRPHLSLGIPRHGGNR